MRTKLVLGLTISAMAAVQVASAQGVSTPLTVDTAVNQVSASVEVLNTSDSIPVTAADFASSDVTADNSSVFASRVDDSADAAASLSLTFDGGNWQPTAATANGSISSPSVVPAVDQFIARRDSTSGTGSADTSWMNAVPAAQGGFNTPAYTAVDASSSPDLDLSFASKSANPIGEVAGASEASGSSARTPLLITPEPGTFGLMILGGTTLLGALRRRK